MKRYESMFHMFRDCAKKYADWPALEHKVDGKWTQYTYETMYQNADKWGRGILALGIKRGEKVGILSDSSTVWATLDFAILGTGAVCVPIYQSNLPDECEYIINNSEAKVVFVENHEQQNKLLEVKKNCPTLEKIVVIDGDTQGDDISITLAELEELGAKQADDAWEKAGEQLNNDDVATYIYTSGTTGPPKGVVLTHGNGTYISYAVDKVLPPSSEDRTLVFLPLAHSFARVVHWTSTARGVCSVYHEGPLGPELLENFVAARPTFITSVPRIFEKVYAKITAQINDAPPVKAKLMQWAIDVGAKVSRVRQKGKEPAGLLAFQYKVATKLVLSKIAALFGGQLKFCVSGGAPLSRDVAELLHACNILVLEGYGLSETTAPTHVNRLENFKFGTVGLPLDGVECKIAKDGEILVRGPNIMREYFKREDDTKEVLSADGWFATGDIGEIDSDGFLRITDRKKDIIVTAGGKNIAPQNIENMMKTIGLVSQFVVHGDKRKFLSAICTLDYEQVEKFAKERGINYKNHDELAENDEVFAAVWKEVERLNSTMPSYETIKKLKVIPGDFSQETGELTPTMKVKRKVINERYGELFDKFYQEKY